MRLQVTLASPEPVLKRVAEHPAAPARALFWLALAALAAVIATVVAMTTYSRKMQAWVEQTTLVYQTSRSALLDLTGPISHTGVVAAMPGFSAERAIARFDSVAELTRDNPQQQARIRSIRELAAQWALATRAGKSVAPGLALAIESSAQEFLAEEQRVYRARSDRFHDAEDAMVIAVTIELGIVGLILVAYARRIDRHIVAAAAQQQQVEEQAAELEEQALELEVSNHEMREAIERAERERRNAGET